MQGAFPVSVAAVSPSGFSSGSAGTKKSPENGGLDAEESLFTPFMTVLAQAAEDAASSEPMETSLPEGSLQEDSLAEGALELTLSASQGELQEEYSTDLPLNGDAFFPNFSKSVLDLLSPLRAELEKEGIDLDALSRKAGEAAEESPSGAEHPDAERLEAMLSALRNRYATTPRSGNPLRPGIDVSVSDSLKLGLEIFLKKNAKSRPEGLKEVSEETLEEGGQDAFGAEETGTSEGEEIFSFAEALSVKEDKTAKEEEAAGLPLTVSRFSSYLKSDAARIPAASDSPKAEKTEKAAKNGELSAGESAGQGILGQAAALPAVLEEREGLNSDLDGAKETPRDALKEGISQARGKGFGDAASGDDAVSAGEERSGAQKRAAAEGGTNSRVNFEQFFEGVMARRNLSESRAGTLELGSGTPLTRDEALREGLTNVVRFARVSGEQRASLIVDPPALGRVSVELTSSATGLEASIKVSSEQIRQLVQDQLVQLRWSLTQQGVQLTHFSVDVQQEDAGRQQQETGRERRRARGVSGLEDGADAQDELAGFRVDLDQGLLFWVA